jgi:hypothetical protein
MHEEQMPEMMLQKKNGSQQMMKTPITVPNVLAAFVSFANLDIFFLGGRFGEADKAAAAAPLPAAAAPPRWIRRVISPSEPPPIEDSCLVPVRGASLR